MNTSLNRIIATGLLGLSLAAGAARAECGDSDNTMHAAKAENPREGIGFGLGAVIGALAGGPPGLILGAAGGALLGHDSDQQRIIKASEQRQQAAELALAEKVQALHTAHAEMARYHQLKVLALQDRARSLSEQEAMQQRMQGMIESMVFTVQFRTGADRLEAHYQAHVERLAQTLKLLPDLRLHLTGYADPRGSEQDNLQLAQHRIDAVRAIFTQAGLAPSRIVETALGEQGVARDGDREAYPFDRRVLIAFTRDGEDGI